MSPIKNHRHDRHIFGPATLDHIQTRHGHPRPIKPRPQKRLWFQPIAILSNKRRRKIQKCLSVLTSPVNAILPEPVTGIWSHCRPGHEIIVWLVIPWEEDQRNIITLARIDDLFDAIRPITDPAQKPHNNEFCFGNDLLAIQVNGHVMRELHEVCEPNCWKIIVPFRSGLCNCRQLRIGCGQEDHASWRLT